MKKIYIINERSNAAIYGVGTFLREYIECLKTIGIKTHLIELNSTQNEFQIKEEKKLTTYLFPYQASINRNKYLNSLIHICRLHIKDSNNLIFHLNYSNSEYLIELLKEYYPLSKILYTIHYQNWTWALNGNLEIYQKIIKKINTKYIQQKYSTIIENYKKEKLAYDQTDKIICLSKDTYNVVQNIYQQNRDKIVFIPNGLKDSKRKREQNHILKTKHLIEEDTKILLYVGRLDKLKGVNFLISSFYDIILSYPNSRLVIIGGAGDFSVPLKLAKNVASKITFTGALSQKELKQWYQIADIGIVPSFAEQCSYVGIEMMMYGLPVVASDSFGVRNMFVDNQNAVIAPVVSYNKEKSYRGNLTKAILKLLFDNNLYAEIQKKSRQTFESDYTIDKMKNKYKELFDSL